MIHKTKIVDKLIDAENAIEQHSEYSFQEKLAYSQSFLESKAKELQFTTNEMFVALHTPGFMITHFERTYIVNNCKELVEISNICNPDMNELSIILETNGYSQQGFGYTKVIDENTHWVTLFEVSKQVDATHAVPGILSDEILPKCQMYAYLSEDEERETIYNTGIISVSSSELQKLIDIFTARK